MTASLLIVVYISLLKFPRDGALKSLKGVTFISCRHAENPITWFPFYRIIRILQKKRGGGDLNMSFEDVNVSISVGKY